MKTILSLSFLFLLLAFPAFSETELMDPGTTTYKKSKDLIIGEIKFNDTLLSDVLVFFQKQTIAADPDKNGLNFILKTSANPNFKEPLVTMNIKKIPLSEALKYVAAMTSYRVQFDENAIVLSPPEFVKKP